MADIEDKDPEKARKQIGKKGEKDSAKFIDLEPTLDEAKGIPAVFTFGRMNPIHTGHEKLVQKLMAVASAEKGMPMLFLSHSQDGQKNPLPYNDKIKFAKKAFGNIVKAVPAKTIMQIMKGLNNKHKKVVLVVGSDRVKEFDTLLNKYNGKEYNFEDIKVVSAGGRDPDAEGVAGMSASKMREYASNRNISKFTKGLPKKLKDSAQDIMAAIRKGMNMSEEFNSENEDYLDDLESLDEALTRQQRRKAGQRMKRMRVKIKRGREKAARRRANIDTLKKRARKKARLMIKSRLAAGKRYADMEPAEKERIDKRLEKIPAQRLNNLAVKLLPSVKRAERDRLQARHNKEDLNVSAENFLMEYKTTSSKPQDPDVADRPGSQPKGYYKGVSKDKKDARAAHFERGAKMSDDNPAAYKPAPGDSDVKTKESKHTKKARAMGYTESNDWVCGKCFCEPCMCGTEDLNEMWGKYVTKRPHMLMDKNNKVKFDKRFKMYQRKSMEESLNMDMSEVENLMESAEAYIKEDAAGKSLADKAKKSGMPKSILRQVYNRGVAAWRTGHRPGTTPEQWGHARVNSFITKSSGTWGKADKDLADKVRKEEVEQMDEISKGLAQRYYSKTQDAKRKAMNTMIDTEKARKPEKKKAYDDARKTFHKRAKGSDMAAKRLAYKGKNEEVEQMDEISKELAQRYYSKSYDAQRKAMNTMIDTEKARKPEKKKAYDDARKTFHKRAKGTGMVAKRLAYKGKNEEVELDESRAEAMTYHKKMSSYHDNMHKELKADGFEKEAQQHAKARNLHFQAEKQHKDFHKDSKKATKRANDHTDAANQSSKGYERDGKKYDHMSSKRFHESVEHLDEAATPQMKKAAASIEAYAKKSGGIDKADFMKAAKMLSSGNAGSNFIKFVDDLDTEPREWLITNLAKTMGKQTVEKMFKVKIREEVELDEISPALAKKVLDKRDSQANRLGSAAKRAAALKNRSLDKARQRRDREMGTNDRKDAEIKKHTDTAKRAGSVGSNLHHAARKADKKADKTYDYMKKRGMKTESVEEAVLDETTMSAVKRPVNVTGPDGKTRTVMKTTKPSQTDDHGQDKIKTNEEKRGRSTMKRLRDIQKDAENFKIKKRKIREDDASLAAHAEKEMRDREKRKEMEAIGKEVDEILDTPKAMKSYNDKNKASHDRAANSAAAKILRGKDKDGKRADHSPELNTMRKRTVGAKLSKNNAMRKTFKALRSESVIKEEGGAGEEGTDKLLKKFKKDTPGEK
jgi:nicotinic acid mononucleotide adenylyltransferase